VRDSSVREDLRRAHVVIVGLMGAGKTTLGSRLAPRLSREFLDNDVLLEARVGDDAATVARVHGEDELHRLEGDVLIDALARRPFAVIAAAASTIERADVRSAFETDAIVVWLRTSVDDLSERLRDPGSSRPLTGDTRATLQHHADERTAAYAAIADVVVDTTGKTPDAVLDEVMMRLS
jgi:shikimate kinase